MSKSLQTKERLWDCPQVFQTALPMSRLQELTVLWLAGKLGGLELVCLELQCDLCGHKGG